MGTFSSPSKPLEQLATIHNKAQLIPNLEPSTPVRAINLVFQDPIASHDAGTSRKQLRH